MDIALMVIVLGLLGICAASAWGPRLHVAAPLLLVIGGIVVSLLPFVPAVEIEPELILAGVLPPLLYSASVSMPAMEFRRELRAISGLSVVLVVASAVLLGLLFSWLVPGIDLGWGIALGAIVSPTDAVATSIVKGSGVSRRVVAILEGESLLNDATALVLLRTAIASAASAFSVWGVLGDFAFAVLVAVVIGAVVGALNIWVRSKIVDPTINTVLSFTVPFIASIPAERLGASGLVAAVVAGLATGQHGPRFLAPQHRLSDTQNWRMIETVLEGAVFLTMGLQLERIVTDVDDAHPGVVPAILVAAAALVATLLIRAAYVVPLLLGLARRAAKHERLQPRVASMREALDDPRKAEQLVERMRSARPRRTPREGDLDRISARVRRMLADIDYFLQAPLGPREGAIVVWAGMRGAVTVAAAQTLPHDTPHRSALVLIAFVVATLSLVLQGSTLGAIIRWVRPASPDPQVARTQRERLMMLLNDAAPDAPPIRPITLEDREGQFATIRARRAVLLDARDDGTFDAEVLEGALAALDAEQIRLELQGGHPAS